MVINRIGPLSCARIAGALYAVIGLIAGAFLSLFSLAGAFGGLSSDSALPAALFGVGSIIILPIFYGVIGFVGSLVGAALYNAVASVVGGIEIDLQ